MQALQGLLLSRFDANRADVAGASGLKQCSCIGRVGLVALDVGARVLGRQQFDLDAQTREPACPLVSQAARFHDHQAHIAIDKPALELGAGEPVGFNDAPTVIGKGKLEHGLGEIDGNGCSIRVGLFSFDEDLIRTPMKTRAPMWRKKRGESIPSFQRPAFGGR